MSDKNKLYYENNKDKYCETVICEGCGAEYRRYAKTAHEKTKKHTTKIMQNELDKMKTLDNMDKKDVIEQMKNKEKELHDKEKTMQEKVKYINNLEDIAKKKAIKVLEKMKIQLEKI
jgi:hypothetical protein